MLPNSSKNGQIAKYCVIGITCLMVAILSSCSSGQQAAPPQNLGLVLNRKVPSFQLYDQSAKPVNFPPANKVVVLAPFLTLCLEVCPMTTGNLEVLTRYLNADGLNKNVEIVEATVDPMRDTPSRLLAYQKRFSANWSLLTGSVTEINKMWQFFGIYHQIVAEPSPPATDWLTDSPLQYDVDHADGFIVIVNGYERFITLSMPNTLSTGGLSNKLKSLLDDQGYFNYQHPNASGPSWTPIQALNVVKWAESGIK